MAIELTADPGTGKASDEPAFVRIGRLGETCVCESRVAHGGAETISRKVDMSPIAEDRLLSEELDHLGPDRVYEEALGFAVGLLESAGGERVVGGS